MPCIRKGRPVKSGLDAPRHRAIPSACSCTCSVPFQRRESQPGTDRRRTRVPAHPTRMMRPRGSDRAATQLWASWRALAQCCTSGRATTRSQHTEADERRPVREQQRALCALQPLRSGLSGATRVSRVHSELTGIRSQAPNLTLCGESGTPYEAKPINPIQVLI